MFLQSMSEAGMGVTSLNNSW